MVAVYNLGLSVRMCFWWGATAKWCSVCTYPQHGKWFCKKIGGFASAVVCPSMLPTSPQPTTTSESTPRPRQRDSLEQFHDRLLGFDVMFPNNLITVACISTIRHQAASLPSRPYDTRASLLRAEMAVLSYLDNSEQNIAGYNCCSALMRYYP